MLRFALDIFPLVHCTKVAFSAAGKLLRNSLRPNIETDSEIQESMVAGVLACAAQGNILSTIPGVAATCSANPMIFSASNRENFKSNAAVEKPVCPTTSTFGENSGPG